MDVTLWYIEMQGSKKEIASTSDYENRPLLLGVDDGVDQTEAITNFKSEIPEAANSRMGQL